MLRTCSRVAHPSLHTWTAATRLNLHSARWSSSSPASPENLPSLALEARLQSQNGAGHAKSGEPRVVEVRELPGQATQPKKDTVVGAALTNGGAGSVGERPTAAAVDKLRLPSEETTLGMRSDDGAPRPELAPKRTKRTKKKKSTPSDQQNQTKVEDAEPPAHRQGMGAAPVEGNLQESTSRDISKRQEAGEPAFTSEKAATQKREKRRKNSTVKDCPLEAKAGEIPIGEQGVEAPTAADAAEKPRSSPGRWLPNELDWKSKGKKPAIERQIPTVSSEAKPSTDGDAPEPLTKTRPATSEALDHEDGSSPREASKIESAETQGPKQREEAEKPAGSSEAESEKAPTPLDVRKKDKVAALLDLVHPDAQGVFSSVLEQPGTDALAIKVLHALLLGRDAVTITSGRQIQEAMRFVHAMLAVQNNTANMASFAGNLRMTKAVRASHGIHTLIICSGVTEFTAVGSVVKSMLGARAETDLAYLQNSSFVNVQALGNRGRIVVLEECQLQRCLKLAKAARHFRNLKAVIVHVAGEVNWQRLTGSLDVLETFNEGHKLHFSIFAAGAAKPAQEMAQSFVSENRLFSSRTHRKTAEHDW